MNRISDLIDPWVRSAPDSPALADAAGAWSYAELQAAVDAAAAWLAELGVRPGDRVLLVSENSRAYVALLFAAARLDAWPVLVNARLATAEIEAIVRHACPRRMVFTRSHRAEMHAQHFHARYDPVATLGEVAAGPLDPAAEPEPVAADPSNRVGAVLYTSGTTGTPRGVMLSHGGLIFAARAAAEIRSFQSEDRLLGGLPLTHSSGLSLVLLAGLSAGACIFLLPRFDPVAALAALSREGVTVFTGAPAMYAQLVEYARFRRIEPQRPPALRLLTSCSSPLTAEIKRAVEEQFSTVLHNGYGATECSPGIASTRVDSPRADTSAGPPYPGVEVKTVNAEGQPTREGEAGEVWVRGPNTMLGYYRAPEETAAVLDAEGWFHTGDLGRFEADNLWILGRSKEMVIRFGFNVYPAEIEALLETHPGVRRAAVVGVPAPEAEGGEALIAFVEPEPASREAPPLAGYLGERLASYKQPARFIAVEQWPLTPTGKIRKQELRRRWLENGLSTVGASHPAGES
jgi:long-chain acyl-CoA synthetase